MEHKTSGQQVRALVEMKMERERPRVRVKLRCKDTVRRELKAWNIRKEGATETGKYGKDSARGRYPAPHMETAAKGEKDENVRYKVRTLFE